MSEDSWPRKDQSAHSRRGFSQTDKHKSSGDLKEDQVLQCTPSELIEEWSPPHKCLVLCRGKENKEHQFVLAKRSRKKKATGVCLTDLPDELVLRIFLDLGYLDLLRCSLVCKRWNHLAFDESLWHSVDMGRLINVGPALNQVLKTRVKRLRCPRASIENLELSKSTSLQIVDLDLSSATISTSTLETLIQACSHLQRLSVEGLQLSDSIIRCLSRNHDLLILNMTGCSNFSAEPLGVLLENCCRLEQLNISWCHFRKDHVKTVVTSLSPSVSHLNLSGYREFLNLTDVKLLVQQCPNLQILDLSDCTLLTADILPVLGQLKHLEHLSLSRCYNINPAALTGLRTTIPSLTHLDVFGLMDGQLPSLKEDIPHIGINTSPFSRTARPTPCRSTGSHNDHTMWTSACRLRFRWS